MAETMNVKVFVNHRGRWQADVVVPDGRDFHGEGSEPGEALLNLGLFWMSQPAPSDVEHLVRSVVRDRNG